MSFANPWGLLGLLALPAIVALHMYQRRFPRMPAAGLHLWGLHVEAHDAGPKRERPPLSRSLLLELLVALLLTLVVSRPRFDATDRAAHLVVVLNSSASMSAEPAGETPLRDRAVQLLQERMRELPPRSVVTILLTGRRTTLLAGPAAPVDEAAALLDDWRPQEPRHDFQPAWDYASQLAAESGRLLFITDRPPVHRPPPTPDNPDPPEEEVQLPKGMEAVSIGQRCDNVAIVTANWTLKPEYAAGGKRVERIAGRVFLWVQNFGSQRAAAVVRANRADGAEVFRETLDLPAGEGRPVERAVAGGVEELQIVVESARDELPLDSRLSLIEPRMKPVRVAIDLPPDTPAHRAFADVFRLMPAVEIGPAETAHLVVGPANRLPASRDDLWWLGVGPLDPSDEAVGNARQIPDSLPFLIERTHPLLKDVELQGVRWAGVQPLELNVTPLISANRQVLLGRLKETETEAYVLNVDLAKSTLTQLPDWLILLHNLVERRRDALPGFRRWNFRAGEDVQFLLPGEHEPQEQPRGPLTLTRIDRDSTEDVTNVARTRLVQFSPPVNPGVYELRDGDEPVGRFAVGFLDPKASDLSQLKPGRRLPEDDAPRSGFFLDQPFSALLFGMLLLALAAAALDWKVLKRAQS